MSTVLLPLLVLLAAACSRDGGEPAAAAGDSAPPREIGADWREDRQALGQSTYEAVCAGCHENGENGAPRTGRREDWADRSDMWQAVLFNHAKSGYLDMPGKGGAPGLTDEAVEAAAEYMLSLTFPELPKD
jgi:cytochrome c5